MEELGRPPDSNIRSPPMAYSEPCRSLELRRDAEAKPVGANSYQDQEEDPPHIPPQSCPQEDMEVQAN